MLIESHIHLLPGIDDGAKNAKMSLEMLEMLKAQGVGRIYATPHFYAHRERSVPDFLEKRAQAYQKIGSPENVRLGAEVAVEHGISELPGIETLAFEGTHLILLEFPYTKYASWMGQEICNIAAEYHLTPVIAHIHRYLELFTKEQMEHVLQMDAVFQVNHEAFKDFRQRRFVHRLLKEEYPVVFGSDSHNLTDRKPNWDLAKKKCRIELLESSNTWFDPVSTG